MPGDLHILKALVPALLAPLRSAGVVELLTRYGLSTTAVDHYLAGEISVISDAVRLIESLQAAVLRSFSLLCDHRRTFQLSASGPAPADETATGTALSGYTIVVAGDKKAALKISATELGEKVEALGGRFSEKVVKGASGKLIVINATKDGKKPPKKVRTVRIPAFCINLSFQLEDAKSLGAIIVKPVWLRVVLETGRLVPFDFVAAAPTLETDIPPFLSHLLEETSKKLDLTVNPDFNCFLKGSHFVV